MERNGPITVELLDGLLLVSAVRNGQTVYVLRSPQVEWTDDLMRPVREVLDGFQAVTEETNLDAGFLAGEHVLTVHRRLRQALSPGSNSDPQGAPGHE